MPDADVFLQLLIHFGYLALFAATFLKGFTIVLVAGALAHEGYLSLPIVMLCSFAGSLAGDEAEYYAGRRYGRAFIAAHPRLNRAGLRIHALLTRYDALFMLGFRFMYGVRIVTPLLLALEGVPPGRFLLYNTVGALIWAILTSLAGYGLGGAADRLSDGVEAHPLSVVLTAAFIVGATAFFLRRKRTAATSDIDSPVE